MVLGFVNVGCAGSGLGGHSDFSWESFLQVTNGIVFFCVWHADSSGIAQVSPVPGALEIGQWEGPLATEPSIRVRA